MDTVSWTRIVFYVFFVFFVFCFSVVVVIETQCVGVAVTFSIFTALVRSYSCFQMSASPFVQSNNWIPFAIERQAMATTSKYPPFSVCSNKVLLSCL